jgi:hypothetical protein
VKTEFESGKSSLLEILAALEPIEEDFLGIEDLPPGPFEFDFDVDPAMEPAFRELIELLSSGRKLIRES